jgi:hypothetical protein
MAKDVNRELKFLLIGVVPERSAELEQLFERYSPRFLFFEEDANKTAPVLEAGAYVYIHFNHKVLRLFWLAAYIAWEGYQAIHMWTQNPNDLDFGRFNSMLAQFYKILNSQDSSTMPMPVGVPEPGQYPGRDQPALLLPAELATFCAGWAMLHELKHFAGPAERSGRRWCRGSPRSG